MEQIFLNASSTQAIKTPNQNRRVFSRPENGSQDKTKSDLNACKKFCSSKKEAREIENTSMIEFDSNSDQIVHTNSQITFSESYFSCLAMNKNIFSWKDIGRE